MKPLDEAGQQLAVEAIGRARRIADRYARIFPEHADDIESSACWGAVRAASSYVPDGGQIWERWSNLCVKGEIQCFLRSPYLKRCKLWTEEMLQCFPEDCRNTADLESREALEGLLGLLPAKYRELCRLVYWDGINPHTAGRSLGMTAKHGCKLHQMALAYLREALAA